MNVDHLVSTRTGTGRCSLFVALESLGIPLPGETDSHRRRHLRRPHPQAVALGHLRGGVGGAIIGDNIGYWIGDKGGYRLLRRYGHYIRVDESKMKIGRYLFDRYGGRVVFFGRFVSILRTYAAFLAGTNRMRWRRFLVFNAAGGILWSAIYTFASYAAGSTMHRVSGDRSTSSWAWWP